MKSAKSGKSGKGGMAKGGNAEQVRAVQQALKDKGHDPGDIDGKMGPKTQAALRDFQSKEGLKASGRLDAETMAKLGVEAKSSSSAAATSPSASPSADTKASSKSDTKSGASAGASSSSSPSASPSSPSSSTSGASSAPSSTDTKSNGSKK
jgi:peptidoglycan hydrolase-like protein with peptidoglycan-binding domain